MAEVRIKVSSGLIYSRKIDRLIELTGVSRSAAIGSLVLLWLWVAEKAPEGMLPRLTDGEIATLCHFSGNDAHSFVSALLEVVFLERNSQGLKIHDWDQWIPEPIRDLLRHERRRKAEKKPNFFGSEQSSSSLVVVSFPTTGETKTWALREELLKQLRDLYPGIDVLLEAKKSLLWLESNPTRRKTVRGMPRFISSWMERAQNRGGGSGPGAAGSGSPPIAPDVRKVIKGWKMLNGIPTSGAESEAWDAVHAPRCAVPAGQLIALFGGWEQAVEAMEHVYTTLKAKGLSCNLDTVVKNSDLYREHRGRIPERARA